MKEKPSDLKFHSQVGDMWTKKILRGYGHSSVFPETPRFYSNYDGVPLLADEIKVTTFHLKLCPHQNGYGLPQMWCPNSFF